MNFQNKKIQQFISSLLILAILAPSVAVFAKPKKAEAQFTDFVAALQRGILTIFSGSSAAAEGTQTSLSLKDFVKEIAKQMLMVLAKRALAEMTKSTVNWINSGFHGAPLFLENPQSFFKDVAKFQVKDFIQVIGYDNIQYPFGKQYALNVISAYKKQLQDNAAYSLSQVTNDPVAQRNLRINFETGGWDAFLVNTQFPQNNPMGFDAVASQEISRRIDGAIKKPAEKVNDMLQQGLGFLSPDYCESRPAYNSLSKNEYNRPSFNFTPPASLVFPDINKYGGDEFDPAYIAAQNQYAQQYDNLKNSAYSTWALTNTCPEGLKKTTPGFVIGSQITKTLGTTQTQKELAAALGTGIGAIFDAMLVKFFAKDSGLGGLATNSNPAPAADDFDYYGNSLDSSVTGGSGNNWTNLEVDLGVFKQQVSGGTVNTVDINGLPITKFVPGAVELTQAELDIMTHDGTANNDGKGPVNTLKLGIIQLLDLSWPKVKELDQCIPGPNKGWEARLDAEKERITNGQLMDETSSQDEEKVKAVHGVIEDLKFAVSEFKDWISVQMITVPDPNYPQRGGLALPSSALFIDAVKETDSLGQKLKEFTDKRREKTTVLAKLKAIERALSAITSQPTPGSQPDTQLKTIRRQYLALENQIASEASIENTRNEKDLIEQKHQRILALLDDCNKERTAAGWLPPNPVAYFWMGTPGGAPKLLAGFRLPTDRTRKYLSYQPSAVGVRPITTLGGKSGGVFKNNIVDYISNGTELEQFCLLPINSGYSHGEVIRQGEASNKNYLGTNNFFTFRNVVNPKGNPGYETLPMVNAQGIYGDYTKTYAPVIVDIECMSLFEVNDQEYKRAGDPTF